MSTPTSSIKSYLRSDDPRLIRRRRRRLLTDKLARYGVALGGISVIIAITLIFFYLAYVVIPLFKPAEVEWAHSYDVPGQYEDSKTVHMVVDEYVSLGARIVQNGDIVFFKPRTGEVLKTFSPKLPDQSTVSSFATGDAVTGLFAYGLDNGQAIVGKLKFKVSYPGDERVITPEMTYPLGSEPITVDTEQAALTQLAIQTAEDEATIIGVVGERELVLTHIAKETNFLDDSVTLETSNFDIEYPGDTVKRILLNPEQRNLYVLDGTDRLHYYDISEKSAPRLVQTVNLVRSGAQVSTMAFLNGGISLMVGYTDGQVRQYFPVRDEDNNHALQRIREFHSQQAPIQSIASEYTRKGFVVGDADGRVGIYHATAERTLKVSAATDASIEKVTVTPRANAILAEDVDGKMHLAWVENEHPEISWKALWGKVWYESYEEPAYIWQSSASTETFEPKFSLTPLSFGTLKAAFYAMLVAVPLAVMGAIFTAHFMSPKMRSFVKPSIEIMEALPTVILGFLAGLWLAPMVEENLPAIFALLLILPVGILAAAFGWSRLPGRIRHQVPEGWEALLLIPVIIVLTWLAFVISPGLETMWFGGDMRTWLKTELGLDFDQRNSIVVGLAMGFAVIPTIFSITEDAIFGVPKHLSHGSLALGATPWQTLWRVVLLTASPGIFSAVMIGLGRAVGETMIVLMATGNTPVMDMSIFQGMRTLSANIAVEMPESEVGSTHFRVLFLAGLVLFLFTFFFNTLAEIVRQRLRKKYSSI